MSMPISTYDDSLDQIAQLVRFFHDNHATYLAQNYKEAEIRHELINPFFVALGWDVGNTRRVSPMLKPVIVEASQDVEGATRAPDYAFRSGQTVKFYTEAKKIAVSIRNDTRPAYQLRSYAWSAKLPLSLLTDFEELSVYDCRFRPTDKDGVATARIHYYTFDQYPDRWREIWDVFSCEAVLSGAYDEYAQAEKPKRGVSEVDDEFLKEIERWRNDLARNIAIRNPSLSIDEMNDAVQRTIDRIVFLRIAEDRGIEPYGTLQNLAKQDGIYPELVQRFKFADARYNSGLFDFSAKGDRLTAALSVDDKLLRGILNDLYFPHSPYRFNVMPVEILGNVYEQFLGKVIRLTPAHQAKVEEKPEVKKAGGVYYTPAYIVDYIVKHTVGQKVEGKDPRQISDLRVLDMACGSGSFLLGAYDFLLDWYTLWYAAHEPEKRKTLWRKDASSAWQLTIDEKKRILTSHIYGVDIDRQAVEVTKLSLLLKVLEGESDETLAPQLPGMAQRVLPNLDANIKCGNSLIGPGYFAGQLTPDADEMKRVNAFDWDAEFPDVMRRGGFDCVIGNPPYIRIQTLKEWAPLEVEAYKKLYKSAGSGNYDIYVVFVEKGLSLLNKSGSLGFILPHKFFNAKYGEPLRGVISQGKHLEHVVHFGDQQVFAGATTYTCLMFLDKAGSDECVLEKVEDLSKWQLDYMVPVHTIHSIQVTAEEWGPTLLQNTTVFSNATQVTDLQDYAHIFQGLATSADSVYVLELVKSGDSVSLLRSRELNGEEIEIESALLHPLLKGSEIVRYSEPIFKNVVLFPYRIFGDKAEVLSEKELRSLYPLAYGYFVRNRSKLLERSKVDQHCYWHYPYPKNLCLYEQRKILIQVLSTSATFTYDALGKYYFLGGGNAGGNGILLDSQDSVNANTYLYLLGILNSRLLTFHVKGVGSRFRGGYYSFAKKSLGGFPVREIDVSNMVDLACHDRMVALVTQMLELHKRLPSARTENDRQLVQRQIDATDKQIDALVYELYGLTDDEIAIVEGR